MEDEEGDSEIRKEIIDLGISEDCKIVGGVFRLVEEKQPHLWIEVAEEVVNKHKNVHFVLVGGGQLLEETRAKLSQRGMSDRIHLVGQTKYVASWMKKMDVLLMTSRVEGLPNVLIEGQGFGLPIVSTDAGGSRETFVDGLTGILSQEGTKADLVKKIENVILDDEWRESASSAAREFSRKEFSIDKMYSRLEEIYGNCEKLPIPKRGLVVSIMGTCRLNLPLRKMSETGRIVLNNSGFESSYLHTTPELIRRMEVLMRRKEYDTEVQRFQCSETDAINPHFRFSIEDSDLMIVEVSSLKIATFHSEPLQINNIFREFCEDRGSEGEKIREAISASLGAEYGGILGEKELNLELFDQFELDLLDNLVIRIQQSSEVISQMEEIAELCPVPVIFLKHINVEGNDGRPIANRVLLSDYMDSSVEGLNILDPTPIVLEYGREMMLEDEGVDLNHYSESGISIIGEWLLNNCIEIIGKKT